VVGGNPAALSGADGAARSRLISLGYAVTIVGDNASVPGDATGKQLIVISSSVSAVNVNTKFRTAAVPVVAWEHALWDDFGMTAAAGTQVAGQTSLSIVTPGSPLAAGLSGTVAVSTVADTLPQGSPGAAAVIAARLPGTSTASDFGYDTGAAMPGLAAPARRVGLFLGDNTAATMTAQGWALFDAAVTWARNAGGGIASIPANQLATYVGPGGEQEPGNNPANPANQTPRVLLLPAGVLLVAVLPERLRLRGPRPHGTARRSRPPEARRSVADTGAARRCAT
jgi:hypothetical protein